MKYIFILILGGLFYSNLCPTPYNYSLDSCVTHLLFFITPNKPHHSILSINY